MDEKEFELIKEISDVCASKKRLLILTALSDNLFLGYVSIKEICKEYDISIGSSEMYKHTNVLIKHGLVEHVENKFIITDKGKRFMVGIDVLTKSFEETEVIE